MCLHYQNFGKIYSENSSEDKMNQFTKIFFEIIDNYSPIEIIREKKTKTIKWSTEELSDIKDYLNLLHDAQTVV